MIGLDDLQGLFLNDRILFRDPHSLCQATLWAGHRWVVTGTWDLYSSWGGLRWSNYLLEPQISHICGLLRRWRANMDACVSVFLGRTCPSSTVKPQVSNAKEKVRGSRREALCWSLRGEICGEIRLWCRELCREILPSSKFLVALEGSGSIGWGNYVYPSTTPNQARLVNTTSYHSPKSKDPSAGLQGHPQAWFPTVHHPVCWPRPCGQCNTFHDSICIFLIVNGEIVCRSLLHRDVSSIQIRASPGFVRCLSMLLRKIKKEINQMYL